MDGGGVGYVEQLCGEQALWGRAVVFSGHHKWGASSGEVVSPVQVGTRAVHGYWGL